MNKVLLRSHHYRIPLDKVQSRYGSVIYFSYLILDLCSTSSTPSRRGKRPRGIPGVRIRWNGRHRVRRLMATSIRSSSCTAGRTNIARLNPCRITCRKTYHRKNSGRHGKSTTSGKNRKRKNLPSDPDVTSKHAPFHKPD